MKYLILTLFCFSICFAQENESITDCYTSRTNTNFSLDSYRRMFYLGVGSYSANDISFSIGDYDTISATTTTAFTMGNYNKISTGYIGAGYYNYLFGKYLYSNTKGLWAFGADNSLKKLRIPFSDAIVFVNEGLTLWQSDPVSLYGGTTIAFQNPHVKDSIRFYIQNVKMGSRVDSLAYGCFYFGANRLFTTDAITGNLKANYYHGYIAFNYDNSDGIFINPNANDGRPFGNLYLCNGDFISQNGNIIVDGTASKTFEVINTTVSPSDTVNSCGWILVRVSGQDYKLKLFK